MSERYGDCLGCAGKGYRLVLFANVSEEKPTSEPDVMMVVTTNAFRKVPCSRCGETGHSGDAFDSKG